MSFSAVEDEILAFLRSEQEAYFRGDFEAFTRHWHHGPEVRRFISGPQVGTRVIYGWKEMERQFREGFRQFPTTSMPAICFAGTIFRCRSRVIWPGFPMI